jgi:hypothetical protein
MANKLFEEGRNQFALGNLQWTTAAGATDVFSVCGITSHLLITCTLDTTGNVYLSDLIATGGGATVLVGSSGKSSLVKFPDLTIIQATHGICDAGDATLVAVTTGPNIAGILVFNKGTTYNNSLCIAIFDTATGLPVTPNNGDIIIQWDGGANKIFKL